MKKKVKSTKGSVGTGNKRIYISEKISITNGLALLQAIVWIMYFVGHTSDGSTFGPV